MKDIFVLVTGGAGRLGIIVCKTLQNKGHHVRILDLASSRNRRSVRELGERAELFWGDINSEDSIRRALDGVDAVVHMAAILPPTTEANAELASKVNVEGTRTLVEAIKSQGRKIPFVFTSSVAIFGPTPESTEPVSVETNTPAPVDVYGRTKLQAETVIRQSNIDYTILRLSASVYTVFRLGDLKQFFGVPLNNRTEVCHPEEVALAIANAVQSFEVIKGRTFIISGGPQGRMLYRDMLKRLFGVLGLPLPPESKFRQQPYHLDYYDTSSSQLNLQYQHKDFDNYLNDFRKGLSRQFTPAFVPLMRHIVGPVFGRIIVRLI